MSIPEVRLTIEEEIAKNIHSTLKYFLNNVSQQNDELPEEEIQFTESRSSNYGQRIQQLTRAAVKKVLSGTRPDPDRVFRVKEVTAQQEIKESYPSVEIVLFVEITPFSSLNTLDKKSIAAILEWRPQNVPNMNLRVYPIFTNFNTIIAQTVPLAEMSLITNSKSIEPSTKIVLPPSIPEGSTIEHESIYTENSLVLPNVLEVIKKHSANKAMVIPVFLTSNQSIFQLMGEEKRVLKNNAIKVVKSNPFFGEYKITSI